MHAATDPFADFPDDNHLFTSAAPKAPVQETGPALYREACRKCRGTGFWSGPGDCTGDRSCTECKGRGFHEYRRSEAERHAARERRHARKERVVTERKNDIAAKRAAWMVQYPAEAAWIERAKERSNFAAAMDETLDRFGDLSPNKLAAVQRIVAGDAAKAAARQEKQAAAPEVNLANLEAAFARAGALLRRPKLRVAGYMFSVAPVGGRNEGSLYVKRMAHGDQEQEYLGKITAGRFIASRDATPDDVKAVLEVAADPRKATEKYGRLTGNCGICGRSLLRESSVEAGIGPICAEKFGW